MSTDSDDVTPPPAAGTDGLAALRDEIDAIDEQLQRLLNQRADCAIRVGKFKSSLGAQAQPPVFYRPEREAQILTKLKQRNAGPLTDADIGTLFREIISCCLSLEQTLTIAYLGPSGTYTEAAAVKQFGHFAQTRPIATTDEVFHEVESGSAHYGVVPVESSVDGVVSHTLDCFIDSPLNVCAEIELPIEHSFLIGAKADPDRIAVVTAHAQALAQCRDWLDRHYPGIERQLMPSNEEAAQLAAARDDCAVLAGEMAARRHGLRVLATHVDDDPDHKTRFLVIGRQDVGPCGLDRTSLLVTAQNESGALYRVLEPFHEHDISLSRIETRPSRGAASADAAFLFFIDLEGHQEDARVKSALRAVADRSLNLRVLGSYPRAVI